MDIYVYVYVYVHVYLYSYDTYGMCIYTYIYTYIYIHTWLKYEAQVSKISVRLKGTPEDRNLQRALSILQLVAEAPS